MDPRYLIAVLAAALIAAGVLTSGFGLFGDDGGGGGGGSASGNERSLISAICSGKVSRCGYVAGRTSFSGSPQTRV